MSIHVAEAELLVPEPAQPAPPSVQRFDDDIEADDSDRLAVARGVAAAVIISAPFWVLIGFTFYMLL
nr:hypothetical protein [uncultured Rhodopila sp.]